MRFRSIECGLRGPFYLGMYEVTQEEYQRVIGGNPSEILQREEAQTGGRTRHAAISGGGSVGGDQCGGLLSRRLSVTLAEEKAAGRNYRLPSGGR